MFLNRKNFRFSLLDYSKPFWNECKLYFSNKHAYGDRKIILIEKEKITNNSNEVIKKEILPVKMMKSLDPLINILQKP